MNDPEQLELPQPNAKKKFSFFGWVRGCALTGVLVTAPAVITIYILYLLVTTLDGWLASFIPPAYRPEELLGYHVHGVGLIAGIAIVFLVGLFAKNLLGRQMVALGERIMHKIPGVSSIYGAIKQVVNTIAEGQSASFREVVLVEYPRKGIWCMAFLTGKTKGQVQKLTDDDMVNVFLPTTPNPTSGFLLFIPKKDVIKLDMTVEQGLKMIISAGIVTPTTAEGKAAVKEEKTEKAE